MNFWQSINLFSLWFYVLFCPREGFLFQGPSGVQLRKRLKEKIYINGSGKGIKWMWWAWCSSHPFIYEHECWTLRIKWWSIIVMTCSTLFILHMYVTLIIVNCSVPPFSRSLELWLYLVLRLILTREREQCGVHFEDFFSSNRALCSASFKQVWVESWKLKGVIVIGNDNGDCKEYIWRLFGTNYENDLMHSTTR